METDLKLYYWNEWDKAVLHYSLNGEEWKDLEFEKIPETFWFNLSIDVSSQTKTDAQTKAPLLEFVLTNREGEWDKPSSGNYEIGEAGSYTVSRGKVERTNPRPLMVVSDLDGTMIGDDEATKTFKHFWQRHSYLTDSKLVYNTGRGLDLFLKLLEEKAGVLEIPDVLISAVGTKIYKHSENQWTEDETWSGRLDQDWDLSATKSAVQTALEKAGGDNMHFRPENEQNEHKITCGVKKTSLDEVLQRIQTELDSNGVKANLIYSGTGEWRFLDIVPKGGGKLEALNYVMNEFGFDEGSTVSCGDSGNDILMMAGSNLAIVVGNAQPDLIEWVEKQTTSEDKERLYVAEGYEADGILEGLKHFGFY